MQIGSSCPTLILLIFVLLQTIVYGMPEAQVEKLKTLECCEGGSDFRCCCQVNGKECEVYGFGFFSHDYNSDCLEYITQGDNFFHCDGCNKYGYKC